MCAIPSRTKRDHWPLLNDTDSADPDNRLFARKNGLVHDVNAKSLVQFFFGRIHIFLHEGPWHFFIIFTLVALTIIP
jgi:hypothetical protein